MSLKRTIEAALKSTEDYFIGACNHFFLLKRGIVVMDDGRFRMRSGMAQGIVVMRRPIQILLGNFSATFKILSNFFVREQLLATFWKTSTFLVTFRLFNLF